MSATPTLSTWSSSLPPMPSAVSLEEEDDIIPDVETKALFFSPLEKQSLRRSRLKQPAAIFPSGHVTGPQPQPHPQCHLRNKIIMEVNVQVERLELAKKFDPGRYSFYCKVETADDVISKSSVLKLDENGRVVNSTSTTPRFSYLFQSLHKELVICLVLTDLKNDDRSVDVAEAFVPMKVHDGKLLNVTAFFTSMLTGLAVARHIGKAVLKIKADFVSEEAQLINTHWVNFKSIPTHLLLMPSEANGELDDKLIADDLIPINSGTEISYFPIEFPSVTILFHSIATEDFNSEYEPVVTSSNQSSIIQQFFPFAKWNTDKTHIKTFQEVSILTKRSVLLSLPQKNIISAHLLKNHSTPIFSTYENYLELVPFCHYHRGWLEDFDKCTTLHDPLLHATKHVITSISCIPPTSEFNQYSGLEFATVRLKVGARDEHKQFIVAVHLIDSERASEYSLQIESESSFQSLLFKNGNPGDNMYMDLITPKAPSSYFFLKKDPESGRFSDIGTDKFPVLFIHICRVEGSFGSSGPWWANNHHCWTMLEINLKVYSMLMSDAAVNGVKWVAVFENENISMSLEGVIRWKKDTWGFLNHLTEAEFDSLPLQESILQPQPSSPEIQQLTNDEVPLELVSSMIKIRQTECSPQLDQSNAEYFQTINLLTKCIQQLHNDITYLKQQNGFLQGQLAYLEKVDGLNPLETKKELEGLSKVDLVRKVMSLQSTLEIERAEKNNYRQKVLEVQNELLKKKDIEGDYKYLQEAHKEQQRLIKVLQRKVEKYYQCYQTALQQERVIEQMEAALVSERRTQEHKPDEKQSDESQQQEREGEVEDGDSSDREMEQRLERLEAMTTLTRANQEDLAMRLEQNEQKESELREIVRQNEKLKFENEKLKGTISLLVNGQAKPEETTKSHAETRSGSIRRQPQQQTTRLITF